MGMKRIKSLGIVCLSLLVAVTELVFTACSNSDSDESDILANYCISGKIVGDDEELVFIRDLNMPANYNYIKTVVVPKDEFPLQQYQPGDIIDFKIVSIKSSYPADDQGFDKPTQYVCSIVRCD